MMNEMFVGIYNKIGSLADRSPNGSAASLVRHAHGDTEDWQFFASSDGVFVLGIAGDRISPPYPAQHSDDHIVATAGAIFGAIGSRDTLERDPGDDRSPAHVFGRIVAGRQFEKLADLEGNWCFAAYDPHERSLVLSSAVLSGGDIFYSVREDAVVFASDVSLLVKLRDQPLTLDQEALFCAVRFQAPPPTRTLVAEIRRVQQGTVVIFTGRKPPTTFRYFRLGEADGHGETADAATFERLKAAYLEELGASVRRRLTQDGRLVLLLSGGVDSALTASVVADICGHGFHTAYAQLGAETLQRGEDLSEREASLFISRRFNTHHSVIDLTAMDLARHLDQFASTCYDGFADSLVLNFFATARILSEMGYEVIGTATGADALFNPVRSERLVTGHLRGSFPHAEIFRLLWALSRTKYGRGFIARVLRHPEWIVPEFDPVRFSQESFSTDFLANIVEREYLRSTSRSYLHPAREDLDSLKNITGTAYRILSAVTKTELANRGRVDKAMRMAGTKWWSPFYSRSLVDLALATPRAFKSRGRLTKYLAREMVATRVGPEIAYRGKYGFSKPIWLPYIETLKMRETVQESRIFSDLPFKKNAKEFVLSTRKMLWPFFVLTKTYDTVLSLNGAASQRQALAAPTSVPHLAGLLSRR